MQIVAKLKHFRTSPRKIRLVTDLIKGLEIETARAQLQYLNKRGSGPVLKLLNSAVANAKHNFNLPEENLYIKNILVDSGPSLKRWRPRAMGRAAPILKRTSHISLILDIKPGVQSKRESKKHPSPAPAEQKKQIPAQIEKEIVVKEAPQEKKEDLKLKKIPPRRPYPTTPQAKKRFFSRQTFGNIKKMFRRKSI